MACSAGGGKVFAVASTQGIFLNDCLETNPMNLSRHSLPTRALQGVLALGLSALVASAAMAHGDVTPQAVDTHTLPQLGDK